MDIYESFLSAINKGIERYGTLTELARVSGVPRTTLSRWYNRHQMPRMEDVAKLCDTLGLQLVPGDKLRDESHDYDFLSIPVIRQDFPLLPGIIPPDAIESWCRVERNSAALKGRKNIIAVRIQDSELAPKIRNGSIVLIDRDDTAIENYRLYLVRDGGRMAVRRIIICDYGVLFKGIVNQERHCIHPFEDSADFIVGRAFWMRCDISDY